MSNVNIQPLAERDIQLREIRKKINNKKMQLKRNMSMLKQEIGTNEELKQILSDYEESVEELKKKKQEQLIYFELMQDYLDKINNDSDLTAEALIRAKDDQRSILEEMKKVKNELAELAEETSS
jgi:chromosome segregation ATPase